MATLKCDLPLRLKNKSKESSNAVPQVQNLATQPKEPNTKPETKAHTQPSSQANTEPNTQPESEDTEAYTTSITDGKPDAGKIHPSQEVSETSGKAAAVEDDRDYDADEDEGLPYRVKKPGWFEG